MLDPTDTPEPTTVCVRFTLRPEFLRRTWLHQTDDGNSTQAVRTMQRQMFVRTARSLWLWPITGIGVHSIMWRLGWIGLDSFHFAWFSAICMGIGYLIVSSSSTTVRRWWRKQIGRSVSEWTYPGFIGESTVEIDDEGLTYRCRFQHSRFAWPDLWEVDVTPGGLSLLLSSGRQILIPADSIATGQSIEEIEHAVREHWDQQTARDECTRSFLADFTVDCQKCGYRLHRVPTCTCPECGRPIEITDLMRAETPTAHPTTTPDSSSTRSA